MKAKERDVAPRGRTENTENMTRDLLSYCAELFLITNISVVIDEPVHA